MSQKIIGVTVGSPLPKPNLMQTDPTKGDYVRGKDGFIEQIKSIGADINIQTAAPGQMIVVKTVDEDGKPTEWEAIDRTHGEGFPEELMPETLLADDGNGGYWDGLEAWYIPQHPLVLLDGETYFVSVNGTQYTCVGTADEDGSIWLNFGSSGDSIGYNPNGLCGYEDIIFVYRPADPHLNDDGIALWEPITLSIHAMTLGVKKLDTKYLNMDAIREAVVKYNEEIFPKTYLSEHGGPGSWDEMECLYSFGLQKPLVVGKNYRVVCDTIAYIVTAEAYSNEHLAANGISIVFGGDRIIYQAGGTDFDENYNALYCPAEVDDSDSTIEGSHMIPVTISIYGSGGDLPTIEMVATLDDGSTMKYRIYGEAVTE